MQKGSRHVETQATVGCGVQHPSHFRQRGEKTTQTKGTAEPPSSAGRRGQGAPTHGHGLWRDGTGPGMLGTSQRAQGELGATEREVCPRLQGDCRCHRAIGNNHPGIVLKQNKAGEGRCVSPGRGNRLPAAHAVPGPSRQGPLPTAPSARPGGVGSARERRLALPEGQGQKQAGVAGARSTTRRDEEGRRDGGVLGGQGTLLRARLGRKILARGDI